MQYLLKKFACAILCLGMSSITPIAAIAGDTVQCIKYLRDIAYNETRIRTSSNVRDTLRFALCKSDFKTKSEAQKAGFGLGITIYEVPFSADGNLDQAKFETWKSTHCENLQTSFSTDDEAEVLIRTVSPEAVQIFNACKSDAGLICAISSPSPEVINVQLNWNPYPGSKAYTTLRSSTVANAKSMEPQTPTGQLAPVKHIIPYGGVIFQLHRADVRRPVNVTVNTDGGSCPPLSVEAEGDFTARVEIFGAIEQLQSRKIAKPVTLVNGACGTVAHMNAEVCDALEVVDVAKVNESSNCGYSDAAVAKTAKCATISVNVSGCPMAQETREVTRCWTEGVNHIRPRRVCGKGTVSVPVCNQTGTFNATVELTGTEWVKVPLKSSTQVLPGRNGTVAVEYPFNADYPVTGYRNPIFEYKASVAYPGAGGRETITNISSAEPTKVEGGYTVTSAINAVDGTLLISVSRPRDLLDASRISTTILSMQPSQFEILDMDIKTSDFDLDAFDAEQMQMLNSAPALK